MIGNAFNWFWEPKDELSDGITPNYQDITIQEKTNKYIQNTYGGKRLNEYLKSTNADTQQFEQTLD